VKNLKTQISDCRFQTPGLRSRRRHGFTLLELTLSMLIAAMLSLTLYSAMSTAFKARKTAMTSVQTTRAGTIASDLIRVDLESVPPPTGVLAGPFIGTHTAAGTGDTDYLQFYSIASGALSTEGDPLNEGVRQVEYYVDSTAQPPVLVRRVVRNLLALTEPQPEVEVLCRNVRSFSLRYWDGTAWQETWESAQMGDVLPLAVGVTIEVFDPLSKVEVNGTPARQITRVVPLACGRIVETSATADSATGTTP